METTSIALVDQNRLAREGLKALFAAEEFSVVSEASSLEEALREIPAGAEPRLVLVDPAPMGDTAQVVRSLKDSCRHAHVVVLTGHLEAHDMAEAIQAGADGFLMKDISVAGLVQSLRLVLMGEKVFPSHLAAMLISGRTAGHEILSAAPSPRGLSRRETQILQRLLGGDSNKMIANALGISEATIKVHLKGLLRKIDATNRTQAAIWALNNGFGAAPAAP
ncbi:LuxR C-terminal-related transcriptional regulator [Arenibaculum pallidiluteum]|uniref:LuxR C-terminal-related transcriptional regulator n=1 Tax=Arenibaculum pallidiluteum TaxID=2812559 RepID=UPI001A974339|nr:response regulator transcription factor [Arenibaculum pallidiluteum]